MSDLSECTTYDAELAKKILGEEDYNAWETENGLQVKHIAELKSYIESQPEYNYLDKLITGKSGIESDGFVDGYDLTLVKELNECFKDLKLVEELNLANDDTIVLWKRQQSLVHNALGEQDYDHFVEHFGEYFEQDVNHSLSAGAIVGIVIGCLAALTIGYYAWKWCKGL